MKIYLTFYLFLNKVKIYKLSVHTEIKFFLKNENLMNLFKIESVVKNLIVFYFYPIYWFKT